MTKKKNEKQKKILRELIDDGAQSCSNIAQKLGMHHNTVKKYISEYEEEGTILGYSCDLAFEKVADTYIVLARCAPFTKDDFNLLKRRIEEGMLDTEKLKVMDSYFTVGEFQAAMIVVCTDVFELHKYLNALVNKYNYIQSYVVLQISRTNQRNLHPNKDWDGLKDFVDFEANITPVIKKKDWFEMD